MPLYEFACQDCQKHSDFFVPVEERDKRKVICACGGKMKRLLSPYSFKMGPHAILNTGKLYKPNEGNV